MECGIVLLMGTSVLSLNHGNAEHDAWFVLGTYRRIPGKREHLLCLLFMTVESSARVSREKSKPKECLKFDDLAEYHPSTQHRCEAVRGWPE